MSEHPMERHYLLEHFTAGSAEKRILELFQKFPVDNACLPDDLFHEFVVVTTAYLLHRATGREKERLQALFLSWGTSCLNPMQDQSAVVSFLRDTFRKARFYPLDPVDLFEEYCNCCRAQREQFFLAELEKDSDQVYALRIVHKNDYRFFDPSTHAPLNALGSILLVASQITRARAAVEPLVSKSPSLIHPERENFYSGELRLVPQLPHSTAWAILKLVEHQSITFLLERVVVRLVLSNPLSLPENVVVGFLCDSCSRDELYVGFQAVNQGDERNELSLYDNCRGYDMCIACVVYFVHSAYTQLREALCGTTPFAMTHAKMIIYAAARHDGCVQLRVALGPKSVRLCVWELPNDTCVTSGDFTAALAALPTPPSDWQTRCRIAPVDRRRQFEKGEECPICLLPLDGGNVILSAVETSCGHWFHTDCLECIRVIGPTPECPLCRNPKYLQTMDEVLLHSAELVLRESRAEREMGTGGEGRVRVAVAAILTKEYGNVTNIVACEVIQLAPGGLFGQEVVEPEAHKHEAQPHASEEEQERGDEDDDDDEQEDQEGALDVLFDLASR